MTSRNRKTCSGTISASCLFFRNAQDIVLHPGRTINDGGFTMPIPADLRTCYPADWPEISAYIRFVRAGGRCERCLRPHGQIILVLENGWWLDADEDTWRDRNGIPTAIPAAWQIRRARWLRERIGCAHLDHDPRNNDERNLAALCRHCHLDHDRLWHMARRRQTYRSRRALGDLFLGSYRRQPGWPSVWPFLTATEQARVHIAA